MLGSNLSCVDWPNATNLHANTLTITLTHTLRTLVLLNLLELLLSVEHVCFAHDLVLTLAVNFILLVLAL